VKQWRWVELATVYAVHERSIEEHGGLAGIRDRAAIESAVARPSISPHMGALTPQTWRQHTPSAWHAIMDSRAATNVRLG